MTLRVVGVAGWKNAGKTTLVERLVAEYVARGRRVATVKHAHHGFDIDQDGTDSFRHRAAGATETLLVSSRRWALMHELRDAPEPTLDAMLARLSPCDLVIVEGFKTAPHPKIEVRRLDARETTPFGQDVPNVVAIASDFPLADETRPVFDLDAVSAIADFLGRVAGLGD